MFRLIALMAIMAIGVSSAPAPGPDPAPEPAAVPPLLSPHPLAYSPSYVKILPVHPGAAVPLTYHTGYKWIHPGSVYLY